MNYITQIKGFWIVAELHQLGHSEISVYFYLLEVWNKTTWAGQFKRQNSKIMGDLRIKSYKTLQSFRDKLVAAGVFSFKQRNGDGNVEYVMADLSKFCQGAENGEYLGKNYRGFGQGSGEGSVQGSGNDLGKNYRVNINLSKEHSPAGASAQNSESAEPTRPILPPVAISPDRPASAPPWTEVEWYFDSVNQSERARKFFEHYESTGWRDGQGKPVFHWQAKANGWITRDIEQAASKGQKAEQRAQRTAAKEQQNGAAVKTADELLEERRIRKAKI